MLLLVRLASCVSFLSRMETDVAPVDAATTAPNESPTQTPSSSSREDHVECKKTDRKRKEPAPSSRVLKSILRQRSELASSAHSTQKGSGQKTRQKRVVKFSLDDKEDEIRKWNGKRLRCLALDLDRWDCLPYRAMRTINKQKTRQTKRLKFCHSFDDLKAERSSRLEVKSEGSLKLDHSDQKGMYICDCLFVVVPFHYYGKSCFGFRNQNFTAE